MAMREAGGHLPADCPDPSGKCEYCLIDDGDCLAEETAGGKGGLSAAAEQAAPAPDGSGLLGDALSAGPVAPEPAVQEAAANGRRAPRQRPVLAAPATKTSWKGADVADYFTLNQRKMMKEVRRPEKLAVPPYRCAMRDEIKEPRDARSIPDPPKLESNYGNGSLERQNV